MSPHYQEQVFDDQLTNNLLSYNNNCKNSKTCQNSPEKDNS